VSYPARYNILFPCCVSAVVKYAFTMNIKIRHFTKIIVLVAVVATLWYFHAKATTFGIVPGSSKDVHDCSQPSGASDNHARLHAEAYRSGMSTKFHSRGLRWLQKWRESEHLPSANYSKGGPLFDSNSGNSRILTDDPDSDQVCLHLLYRLLYLYANVLHFDSCSGSALMNDCEFYSLLSEDNC